MAHGSPGVNLNDVDYFSSSLTLSGVGDILAVGARLDDTGGTNRGAAYLFNLNPADLTQAPTFRYKLAHGSSGLSLSDSDIFGTSLALNGIGDILAVGARLDDTGGSSRGAAYLFNLNPADLTQAPTLQYKLAHGSSGLTLNDGDNFGASLALNGVGDILAVGAYGDDTGGADRGAAYLFNQGKAEFGDSAGLNSQISPAFLETLLSTGNALTLQASNDIFVNDPINVGNAWGDGGNFTLQAGRSLVLNANITTDNGNLTLIANDQLASGVVDAYRDPGTATITMGAGVTMDAGTGSLVMELRDGAGKTYTAGGDITLQNLNANDISITNSLGSILDGNGAANNLTALANSTLDAAGTIGTDVDPLDVNINGGDLNVSAAGIINGYSVNINGTVNPANQLTKIGGFLGLVCFNGDCGLGSGGAATTNSLTTPFFLSVVDNSIINNNRTELRNDPAEFKHVVFQYSNKHGGTLSGTNRAEILPLPPPVNLDGIENIAPSKVSWGITSGIGSEAD